MRAISSMGIKADKDEILKKLRQNREKHAQVVKEAREGYLEKAKVALAKRIDQLAAGKLVSLTFQLCPPQDYTYIYDTAITMLELEKRQTVKLSNQQVRTLIMDEWDWSRTFFMSNANISTAASAENSLRGYTIS